MSIPMLFVEDIVGLEGGVLMLNAVVEVLKLLGEKENLFADFPIGATMQDGGKRKRSDGDTESYQSLDLALKINRK